MVSTVRLGRAGRRLCAIFRLFAAVRIDEFAGMGSPRGKHSAGRFGLFRQQGAPSNRETGDQSPLLATPEAVWRIRTGPHAGEYLVQSVRRTPRCKPSRCGAELLLFRP